MLDYTPHAHEQPSDEAPRDRADGWIKRAGLWSFALASIMLLALASVVTWRWVNGNLLHWGIDDGTTQTVNGAELLERIRAFELATVKQTYASQTRIDADKVFNAGPVHVSLPGWAAGQRLDAKGKATITAGVDLARVRPEDMEVIRQGKDTQILIRVPAPEVLSAELVPNTLEFDASAGVLTRIGQSLGVSEADLRVRAADQVVLAARESALEQGILDDATRETERRLQAFLQSMPQPGGRVTYIVTVREPAAQ
jgi:hypothetical protein